jgi:hypothetical protein
MAPSASGGGPNPESGSAAVPLTGTDIDVTR